MSNKALADELISLFVHRNDVYAEQDKKNKYKPIHKPITNELIQQHLKGEITIGIYSLKKDNTVNLLCFDIDNHDDEVIVDWKHQSSEIIKHLWDEYELPTYVEMSGTKGSVHLYVFLEPTNAKKVREFGNHVINELNIKCEIFPKNDELSGKGLGNLLKLPLGYHKSVKRWSKLLFSPVGKPLYKHKACGKDNIFYLKSITTNKLPESYKTKKKDKTISKFTDTKIRQTIHEGIKEKNKPTSYIAEAVNRLNKICIKIIYYKQIQLNGPDGHEMRLAIIRDLIVSKWKDSLIHQFFKTQYNYNRSRISIEITDRKKKINKEIKDKQIELNDPEYKYKPLSSCGKMQKNCSPLINPLCDACNLKKELNTYLSHGGNPRDLEFKTFMIDFKNQWKYIKKNGEKTNKHIKISVEDILKYTNIKNKELDNFINSLKLYNLIKLSKNMEGIHRIDYKEKRTRNVLLFKIKESEDFIK